MFGELSRDTPRGRNPCDVEQQAHVIEQQERQNMRISAVLALALGIFGVMVMGQESKENLKAYPAAEAGMKRCVIHLESKDKEESDYRIELQIGKTIEVDEANRYFFGGKLEEVSVEGWGYPKYVAKELGPLAGTRIGIDASGPKVKRFVMLGGEPSLLRYNSRLPVVVYVPDDAEVRLRVWKALPDALLVPEG
jgi:ecotin